MDENQSNSHQLFQVLTFFHIFLPCTPLLFFFPPSWRNPVLNLTFILPADVFVLLFQMHDSLTIELSCMFSNFYNSIYCATSSALLFSLVVILLRFICVHMCCSSLFILTCMVFPCIHVSQLIFLVSCQLTLSWFPFLLWQCCSERGDVRISLGGACWDAEDPRRHLPRWHWASPSGCAVLHSPSTELLHSQTFPFRQFDRCEMVSVLLCISLATSEFEHLSKCYVLLCKVCSYVFVGALCMSLILILCQWCVCGESLPVCDLSFHFVFSVFCWIEDFNFKGKNFICLFGFWGFFVCGGG